MSHSRKTSSDNNNHSSNTSSAGKRALGETLALISSIQQQLPKQDKSDLTESTRSSFISKIHPYQFARFYLKKVDSNEETDLIGIDSKSNTPRDEMDFNYDLHRSKSDSELLIDDEGHNIYISNLK